MARVGFRLEAIRPNEGKARAVYQREIRTIFHKIAAIIERDFEQSVKDWDRKPKFYVVVETEAGRLGVTAGTDDEIYGYVTHGTKPHIIRPKRAKALAFVWGGPGSYQAKTKPGRIMSRPGGMVSGEPVKFQQVNHPGFPGRKFDVLIAKRRQASVKSMLEKAIAKANAQVNANRRKGQKK